MPTTFIDFDILIDRASTANTYRARVINSPGGQGNAEFTLAITPADLDNLRANPGDANLARAFGTKLFSTVFTGDVLAAFRSSLDATARAKQGLRVRLRLGDVPELASLPWEYLYSAPQDRFIAQSTDTPLVRFLELPEHIEPLAIKPPLRMLVVISAPSDYPPLDVEKEWSRLNDALGGLEEQGLLIRERLVTPTLTALQQKLREGDYHIIHYIGHGGFIENTQDGALAFEDDNKRGRLVTGRDLGIFLRDEKSLHLVVLNACEGARSSTQNAFGGLAPGLVQQGVPAVIAMQFEISDSAAIAFALGFYNALATPGGFPVDAALSEARKTIFDKANNAEWATPVLFMRAADGKIFDLAQLSDDERKHLRVNGLDRAAQLAYDRADWATTIKLLQARQALELNAEAANKLTQAQREQQLAQMYADAKAHYDAKRWREAVTGLAAIKQMALNYKDVESLLASAQKNLPPDQTTAATPPTAPTMPTVAGAPDAHYQALVKAMLDGRLIAFLGSGANLCGRPIGKKWEIGQFLPSGAELAEYLANNYAYTAADKSDLTRVSQFVALMNGEGPLFDELHKVLDADYPFTSLHEFFATLPGLWRSKGLPMRYMLIVTTNYDDLLERAFRAANEPYDLVSYVSDGEQAGKFRHTPPQGDSVIIDKPNEYRGLALDQRTVILKLHGAISRANPEEDSYVITEDDYIQYLARTDISNLIPVTLAAKLRRSNFIFLGYSLSDWSLRVILHRIWGDQKLSYKSWAVSLDPQALDQEFWHKRDVELIKDPLDAYIAALRAHMQTITPAAAKT